MRRILLSLAAILVIAAVRPAAAQGISGDNPGPHVCTQPTPEAATPAWDHLPTWLTGLQLRFPLSTLCWTVAPRQSVAAAPAPHPFLAILPRPRD